MFFTIKWIFNQCHVCIASIMKKDKNCTVADIPEICLWPGKTLSNLPSLPPSSTSIIKVLVLFLLQCHRNNFSQFHNKLSKSSVYQNLIITSVKNKCTILLFHKTSYAFTESVCLLFHAVLKSAVWAVQITVMIKEECHIFPKSHAVKQNLKLHKSSWTNIWEEDMVKVVFLFTMQYHRRREINILFFLYT